MPYIEGIAREQTALLPSRVEDYVDEGSVVRYIDALAWSLPMAELGFERAVAAATGRPGFRPQMMLALWIYGYVNGLTSSRKLEREASRNLEVMWLTQMLKPDFKTISDFRRDHKGAVVAVFRRLTKQIREEGLIAGELVAIDGSKFRAVNSSDRNYSKGKLERLEKQIEKRIDDYMREVEQNDAREEAEAPGRAISGEEMKEKLRRLRERKGEYQELIEELRKSGEKQISTTDPESRSMKTRRGTNVCYNAQIAVDEQHKLIVVADVTNEPTDQRQLSGIAKQAKEALGVETLEVVADKGYSNSKELSGCKEAGITTYVSQPQWRRNAANGRFSKEDFTYHSQNDVYICPAGSELTFRYEGKIKKNRIVRYYRSDSCGSCPMRSSCLAPKQKWRRIARRADEDAISAAAGRARNRPDLMAKRKAMAEHPFGSIKRWINGGYFLLKGLDGVRAEFSLAALAYNIKRVWTIRNPAVFASC